MKLKAKKTNPVIPIVITAAVSIVATIGVVLAINAGKKEEVPEDIATFIQEGEEDFTIDELKQTLEAASDLVTEKYHYTAVGKDEKEGKKIAGITLPGTSELTLLIYDGTIHAGIDVSEIQPTIDNESKTITLALPEPKIISHEIDESSFEAYDVKTAAFSKKTYEDLGEMISEFKATKEEELETDEEFWENVTEEAENALTTLLTTVSGDYEVVFEEAGTTGTKKDTDSEVDEETTAEEE